jgi:ABC-type transport system involved in multi-copper enzyme maturation permease subunit
MLHTLLIKEIHESIITLRFLIVTLLCLILIPFGGYATLKDYQKREQEYRQAERIYQTHSEGKVNTYFQAEAQRPPSALSIIATGLDEDLPNRITTARDGHFELSTKKETDNLLSRFFGKIDYLFIISTILSLAAFMFTFDSIAGEKERCTLRLIMANQVPRWKVIIAKLVGNYLVFAAPLIVAELVLLIFMSFGPEALSAALIFRIAVVYTVTAIFLLTMFTIGILFSLLTGRSTTAIMTLLLIWVLFVTVIPKASPMLAEMIHPVRSREVVNMELQMARENLENELNKEREKLIGQVGDEYGITINAMSVMRAEGDREKTQKAIDQYEKLRVPLEQEYTNRVSSTLGRIEESYRNELMAQASIGRNLARLSPVSCIMFLVSELAGTGPKEERNIRENAQAFQDQVKIEVYDQFDEVFYATPDGSRLNMSHAKEGVDQKSIAPPRLAVYRRPSMAAILAAEWADIGLLLFYTVLFFVLSYVSFLRYDVR